MSILFLNNRAHFACNQAKAIIFYQRGLVARPVVFHENEDVHGPNLGDLVVITDQPQALLAALSFCHFLKEKS